MSIKDAQIRQSISWRSLLLHVRNTKKFLTLGRLCCIEAKAKNNKLYLIYDVWEGAGEVSESHFIKVFKRYAYLKTIGLHTKVQQYQTPRWRHSPDFIYSPYVAAIIHDYFMSYDSKKNSTN